MLIRSSAMSLPRRLQKQLPICSPTLGDLIRHHGSRRSASGHGAVDLFGQKSREHDPDPWIHFEFLEHCLHLLQEHRAILAPGYLGLLPEQVHETALGALDDRRWFRCLDPPARVVEDLPNMFKDVAPQTER